MRHGMTMAALAFLAACSNSDLPDAFRLDRFRVLAVLADRAEVAPSETVVLTPFLSDLTGEGRPITFTAEGCLDPGVGFGAEPSCEGSPTQVVLATDVPVTGLSAPHYTGAVTSTLSVTVPPEEVVFAQASERARFNGVNYMVTFTFSFSDGTVSRAFRQIPVSERSVKNANPAYGAAPLLGDGDPLTESPTAEVSLTPSFRGGSAESYEEIRDDGETVTKTEKLETSWYIADGDLSLSVTDGEEPTVFTPPLVAPEDRGLLFVLVTRDGRGGVTAFLQGF